MKGNIYQPEHLLAFYRPARRAFSPLTNGDMQTLTGCSRDEAISIMRSMARIGLVKGEKTTRRAEANVYDLTPKGEALASSIISARDVVMKKVAA